MSTATNDELLSQHSQLDIWFREAKQSLSIAGPICTEANELVLTSREQIEVATVMWSRVMFVHRAVNDQFDLLNKIKQSFKNLETSCQDDFKNSLQELDDLEEKLDLTLNHLEHTFLDEAFRIDNKGGSASSNGSVEPDNVGGGGGSGSSGGGRNAMGTASGSSGNGSGRGFFGGARTLRTFVHDSGIDNLRQAVGIAVEKSQVIVKDLAKVIESLDADINEFHKDMFSVQAIKRRGLEAAHENTVSVATDAHAMALLLESLTRHYDLCLKAIEMSKTPEKYKDDLPEVAKILKNDSQELEAVVEELYERRKFIEVSEAAVSSFYKQMNDLNMKVQTFFSELLVFGVSKLTGYSEKLEEALRIHQSQMQEIYKLKQELQSLVDYYGLFHSAYQALILEVLRRRKSQQRMKAMVSDMLKQVHNAHDDEVRARQGFVKQYGDYLPNDLWEGLLNFPLEPQIIMENERFPEISEASIAEATRRIEL
ncbi:protein kinase regulatory subunit ATG17 [Sugiyamaella lignohabitans]|uniref:Autophagy-related protein 17 n=1 Tax=Sugiyamaella lignohabitans TaxID=796027 RepID=A0A167FF92_9ASCO|nr:protein kinase regulatory subunit ATG17 [Sugiyamaella lignohabitans]ANB15223.1 protein kinase regulatory subunit ATG17 [Sugiyamaella lignohabitans]